MRPLRRTPAGPVVRYKRRLWRVHNNSINLSDAPVAESDEPEILDVPLPVINGVDGARAVCAVSQESGRAADFTSTDQEQDIVTRAGPEERLLVDAGPGTGKTHTACIKVAALIREYDLPPSRIWMISFTRTAVHEIRSRLAALLEDAGEAASVRICGSALMFCWHRVLIRARLIVCECLAFLFAFFPG